MVELETGNLMKISKNSKMSKIGVIQNSSPNNYLRANTPENKLGVRVKESEIHIVQNVADWTNSKVTTIELKSKVIDFHLFDKKILILHKRKLTLFEVLNEGFLVNQAEMELDEENGVPVKTCICQNKEFILISYINNKKEKKCSKFEFIRLEKNLKHSENDFMFKPQFPSKKSYEFKLISKLDFEKLNLSSKKNSQFLHISLDFKRKCEKGEKNEQENNIMEMKTEEFPLIIGLQSGGGQNLVVYQYKENMIGNGCFELLKLIERYHGKSVADMKVCGDKIWSVDTGGQINRMYVKFVEDLEIQEKDA